MSGPWLKFYPSDWRSDPGLRMCSLAARGLWMDLLCIMHEADGYLRVNGRPLHARQVAGLVGTSPVEIEDLLQELEANGVYSRTEDGTIYSRRMLKDIDREARDKANGKLGGNPKLRKGEKAGVNPGVGEGDKAQKPEARDQIPEEGKRPTSASQPYREPGRTDADLEAVLRGAAGLENSDQPGLMIVGPIHALMAEGYDLEKHILPVIRHLRAKGKRWNAWTYIVEAVRDRNAIPKAQAGQPPPAPPDPAKERRGLQAMARGFLVDDRWSDAWGPRPGEPGCKIPNDVIAAVAQEIGAQWPPKGKRAA